MLLKAYLHILLPLQIGCFIIEGYNKYKIFYIIIFPSALYLLGYQVILNPCYQHILFVFPLDIVILSVLTYLLLFVELPITF